VPELQRGGAPVLLTGIGLPDDGLHSPNEKVDLQQIWDGINVFAAFFRLYAERGAGKTQKEPEAEEEAEEE
jgi:acetylornithine deacetylase/succinyl-diaminopimelate desuccinylase-like protein